MHTLYTLSALAWPLVALVIVVLIVWLVRSDLHPIVAGMVAGIAAHAQKYAPAYGIAFLLGMAASLQSLAEVAEKLGWVYCGAAAKVLQPGIVAIIGFILRSPAQSTPSEPPKP